MNIIKTGGDLVIILSSAIIAATVYYAIMLPAGFFYITTVNILIQMFNPIAIIMAIFGAWILAITAAIKTVLIINGKELKRIIKETDEWMEEQERQKENKKRWEYNG